MDEILARLLPPGSMARREYDLPQHLHERLTNHRQKSAAIICRCEKIGGSGSWYERLINNDMEMPPMPSELAEALGMVEPPTLTVDMSVDEVAELWRTYSQGSE